MAKLDERIDSLEARIKALKKQKQRLDRRASVIAVKRTKQQEMRRKILVGTAVLDRVAAGELPLSTLLDWLSPVLRRPEDRALFDAAAGDE